MRKNTSSTANSDDSQLNAIVVGAGPSGLVAAKYLLASTNPTYKVTVLEQSPQIGGTFVNKVYDNTRLVSSKYITAFSDFRMSEDAAVCPNHPSAQQYVEYLNSYWDHFCLGQRIQFGCTVVSMKDAEGADIFNDDSKGYEVQYHNTDGQAITQHFDVVSICSGLHNTPNIPREFDPSNPNSLVHKFKGLIIHSSQYKDPAVFTNKRVLVLGSGETAMDICHRAIMNPHSKSVALCVRRGFLSIPHNLAEDRPLDVFITNLFEHAYEHPWVHALRLRWVLSTIFIRLFLLLTGSSFGFNQWAVPTTPIRRGYHIINKSHAAMGHLNVPIKAKTAWGRFWMWAYGETNLRPIISFHKTQVVDVEEDVTVRFDDGRIYEADLIVMATGYKQSFPFLDEKIREDFQRESLEAKGATSTGGETKCKYALDEDYLPSEHFIASKNRPRLGFIGFVRPNVGAIPPMSELQVMWWLQRMAGKIDMLPAKAGPPSYMVLGAKYQYGVDYGNYMHRVAEDIGAAPTLSTLARSNEPLKTLFTYCIGQSMVPLFRLEGPYASKLCWEVVAGELWRVCMRRGWAENVGLVYMTYLSLLMNMTACALECVWCLLTLRKPKFFVRY
jgi:dimethylaniline monooxygenase (N-oxide forming)